jgi:putative transposase
MADEMRMALTELLRKTELDQHPDFLREGVRVLLQAIMEEDITQRVGAERHERSEERRDQRNGYRDRQWDTRVGSLELKIPRLRVGNYLPGFLDPRKRAERALTAVVQEAYVLGVSTRKVDDLVQALGIQGMSRSQVSRICGELDEEVERFRSRRLDGAYPYIWLDATYVKVREGGRVVSQAVVVAIGVRSSGEREVLGLDVGASEDGAFWLAFLRSLVARGLSGVQLVVSDAHAGLRAAIGAALAGAAWQRCRVHFLRNVLALVPKHAQQMVAASIRTVFVQADRPSAVATWRKVVEGLRRQHPRVAALMEEAEADVLAYADFPAEHWRQIWSNNPLERLNKEIKRRTDVVGIFPNSAAVIRLVGAVLAEQHDEWQVSRRYFSAESLGKLPPLLSRPSLAEKASAGA